MICPSQPHQSLKLTFLSCDLVWDFYVLQLVVVVVEILIINKLKPRLL